MNLGLPEIVLIVLVLIIFFGSKRITDLAKDAGIAGKELKKIKKEYKEASK
jgi:TatA/E family protein of Tat protein translocase